MAMQTYACTDYGLYVTEDDLSVYAEKNNLKPDYDLILDIGGNFYSGADGECKTLKNGFNSTIDIDSDMEFGILPLERSPSLCEKAYESCEEAIQELKTNFGEYLPDDFDYEQRLVMFVGTVFG